MNNTIYTIGLGLAIALLICLFPMPYGYYNLIRFSAMIIFGYMAYHFSENNKTSLCIIALSLALLFQPFFKIALGKTMWNVVDVVVAIALILFWYRNKEA